jgi:hypothetical protein
MAAGSTYSPIATTTLGSSAASYTFNSIPNTYTDLILVLSGYAITQDNSFLCRVGNGSVDTGNNYSQTAIRGDGSTAASNRFSNVDFMRLQANGGMGTTSSHIGTYIAHFMNYANTSTYKTVLSRANQSGGAYPAVEAVVNLWRSTSAINIITVFPFTGASFGTGTQITLYGIAAA